MSNSRFAPQLPADAARYLAAVRRVEQPIDLVDNIMAEVESTPQVSPAPDVRTVSRLILAAAAVLLALAVILRFGAPNVGPAPTPVPLDQLPSAGQLQNRYSIEADDVPSAIGHGFIWLTNRTRGELVRMNPANGSIMTPLQVAEPGDGVTIGLTESSVWVADPRDSTLVELDPVSREERRRVPLSATVSAIATDGAILWVLDAAAGALFRIDTAGPATAETVAVAGSALLVHGGWVWVADDGGTLVRLDPANGVETARVEIGMAAEQLVGSGGSILAVANGEPLLRIGIGSMSVESRGIPVRAVVSQDGLLWALVQPGHLVRLDPDRLQPVAATPIEIETPDGLAMGEGSIWTTGSDASGWALLEFVPAGE